MSRRLYDDLGRTGRDDDTWKDEEDVPEPLLRALAKEGRVRRAATDLADEEFREGAWVETERPEAAAPLRLAADDRATRTRRYRGGAWVVRADRDEQGAWRLEQEAGPVGGTIVLDGPTYVPLVPGVPAPLPAGVAPPDALQLLDAAGRQVRLDADPAPQG
jgi:hypothetical protein